MDNRSSCPTTGCWEQLATGTSPRCRSGTAGSGASTWNICFAVDDRISWPEAAVLLGITTPTGTTTYAPDLTSQTQISNAYAAVPPEAL
jgi:hypothetical protein